MIHNRCAFYNKQIVKMQVGSIAWVASISETTHQESQTCSAEKLCLDLTAEIFHRLLG